MFEFLLYLNSSSTDIYNLVSRTHTYYENSYMCKKHPNYFGLTNSNDNSVHICTDTIKKYVPTMYRYYLNETIIHEAVHVAQDCKSPHLGHYEPFNIDPKTMQLNESRRGSLSRSMNVDNPIMNKIEHEAFWLEDKPHIVKYVLKKYCM